MSKQIETDQENTGVSDVFAFERMCAPWSKGASIEIKEKADNVAVMIESGDDDEVRTFSLYLSPEQAEGVVADLELALAEL